MESLTHFLFCTLVIIIMQEDILRKCTKLRMVQIEQPYSQAAVEMLVQHGIVVEHTPRQ